MVQAFDANVNKPKLNAERNGKTCCSVDLCHALVLNQIITEDEAKISVANSTTARRITVNCDIGKTAHISSVTKICPLHVENVTHFSPSPQQALSQCPPPPPSMKVDC